MSTPPSWRIDLDHFEPLAVGSVELRDDIAAQCEQFLASAPTNTSSSRARLLLRIDGHPIGYATAALSDDAFTQSIRDQAMRELSGHLGRDAVSLSELVS